MTPTMKKTLAVALAAASVLPATAMADTPKDNTNQSCSTPDSIDAGNTTLSAACSTLDTLLHSQDSTVKTVYDKAKPDGQTAYTADSARKLVEAYNRAELLWQKTGITTDDVDDMNKAASDLKVQAANMTVATWTVTDGDQTSTLSGATAPGGTGREYTGTLAHKPTGDLHVDGSDGSKINLTHDTARDTQTPGTLYGQTAHTARYVAAPTANRPGFTVTAEWTDGEAVTASLADGKKGDIKKDDSGDYQLGGTVGLDDKNFAPDHIDLSDGTQLTGIDWSEVKYTKENGVAFVRRFATNAATVTRIVKDEDSKETKVPVTDKDGKEIKIKLDLTAKRTHDSSANLALTYTDKAGKQQSIPVTGYDKDKDGPVTLGKLPYSEMGDAFTLSPTAVGPDAEVKVDDRPAVASDGTRSWSVTTTYTDEEGNSHTHTMQVTLPFEQPARQVTNTDARLAGLLVNGQPIAGWDADTLDYTITAKGDEPYKVSPKAADGQTVAASDVTQGAGTTRQEWTVSKNGQTRVYSVTVIRKHEPTAAERFDPADPTDQDGKTPAPGPSVTDLKSYGYTIKDKDGKTQYKTFATDDHTIPEGGVFAYQSYQNQVVTVKGGRVSGMTWRYTLTVLSQDNHVGVHTVDVTYLTAATHKADLTGIRFDGKNLDGFDPARHEYAVQVSDPARYTVMPVFDQSTGMTVSTHKTDGKAVVTVTSADGLTKTVYTFNVSQAPLPILSGTQAGHLAQTGTVVGAIGVAVAVLAAVLAGCAAWLVGRRRKGEGGKDIVA